MKKFINPLLLITILAQFGTGCQKSLDKQLQGVYSTSTFYQTSLQAEQAVNAAYQPLAFTSATSNCIWVFGDVASDDAVKGGNAGDQTDIGLIDQFNVIPTNGNLGNEWGTLYEGITRCNMVLNRVPLIVMDASLQTRILAEARFLRAWYYFSLINVFGDVPIVLIPLNGDQLQIAQSPAKDIYESVIEPDLRIAAANLPAVYTGDTIGRATSGAAMSLLAKAYLFQSKWDSAVTAAGTVVNSNLYSLMPVYSQDFSALHKNNQESVFEVQMMSGQNPLIGNSLNQWFAPAIYGGYYFDAPTQDFVDEFEKTPAGVVDPRLDYTVGRDSAAWFNGLLFSSSWSPTGYLTRKFQQSFTEAPIIGDGNVDYMAIRYADVLLFYAEALNETGQTAQALIPLNQVRKRARESYLYDSTLPAFPDTAGNRTVPPGLLPNINVTNQTDLRAAIQHERRVELGFEFHRYFDVIRWGEVYADQVMINSPGFNYALYKTFPIPQSERDTDKALK
jgi:starch-binding outer membrane protein, SusD/RagB family